MFSFNRFNNVINVSVNNYDLGDINITTQNVINMMLTTILGFATTAIIVMQNIK